MVNKSTATTSFTTFTTKNLYQRLGGYDAIAAVCDDLIKRLTTDPQIGVYWRGMSTDSLKKNRQLLVDFLCMAFGGPCVYTGRDMKLVHTGLKISESDWQVFVKHAIATLDKFGVQGKEREEMLSAVSSLKNDTVGL